ncbi:MAG: hypothetical protein ABEJ79_01875 [Halolamina sp.]
MSRPVILGAVVGIVGVPLVAIAHTSAGSLGGVLAVVVVGLAGAAIRVDFKDVGDEAATTCHHCGVDNDGERDHCRVCGAAL